MGYQEYKQFVAFGLGMWAVIILRFLSNGATFEPIMDYILIGIATFYLVFAEIIRRVEMREDGQ